MTRNKGVTKSLREQWKQPPKPLRQKKERVRSQIAEISQRKGKIAMGLVVGNLVTQQGQSGPGKTNKK